jgi:astacin
MKGRSVLLTLTLAVGIACGDPAGPPDISSLHDASSQVGDPENGTGWIIGRDGKPIFVRFDVVDGFGVLEGDMVLGPVKRIARTRAELSQPGLVAIDASNCWGSTGLCATTRWPYGVVPYVISGTFSQAQRNSIVAGMRLIDSRASGVQFRPKSSSDANWVVFELSGACNSILGRFGGGFWAGYAGAQTINLTSSCASVPGVVAHEALHALGAWHEQSRCDRDNFVQILTQNIQSGKGDQFQKQCSGSTDYGPYAEESVMHYGATYFSANGLPTIVSLRGRPIGQRDSLATNDWQTLNLVYAPYPPMVTSLVEIDGYPYLTLSKPAGLEYYDVNLIQVWEEWDDYSGTFSTFDGASSYVGFTLTGRIHDLINQYTGTSRCYEYQHTYGSGSYAYVYEITPWFAGGVQGTKLRWPAPVAPEYSPCV